MDKKIIASINIFIIFLLNFTCGAVRQCFKCRSRGELGDCKDDFSFNATISGKLKGVEIIPCASGWCSKIIEGGRDNDYEIATERNCLQRGPSDGEERCAKTEWNHKKVYMCLCQGDLCNSSSNLSQNLIYVVSPLLISYLIINKLI